MLCVTHFILYDVFKSLSKMKELNVKNGIKGIQEKILASQSSGMEKPKIT